MELSLEYMVAFLTLAVIGCIACLVFLVSPYEIYFEDAEGVEEI
jgi:hypothetical protein